MRIKIIICLMLSYLNALALQGDSIRRVVLGEKAIFNDQRTAIDIEEMAHPFFDTDKQQFFVKIELENASTSKEGAFVFLEVKKRSLQQFRLRPIVSKKIILRQQTMLIDSLGIPDSLFASGNYDLITSFMQDSFHVFQVKKTPFQMLRNNNRVVKDEFFSVDTSAQSFTIPLEKTFVEKYPLTQIRKNISSLSPLAKGTEKKVIKEIVLSDDLTSLKQFFYNFWFNRNPADPEKAWNDYVLILNEVAKRYGYSTTPGYETDRGRIYIQYGAPDRVERVINEKEALPYEIWFYYNSGTRHNVKFLFFQPGMLTQEVLLLHSNIPEELVNPYWKALLITGDPNSADNKLKHKVFEFFN